MNLVKTVCKITDIGVVLKQELMSGIDINYTGYQELIKKIVNQRIFKKGKENATLRKALYVNSKTNASDNSTNSNSESQKLSCTY